MAFLSEKKEKKQIFESRNEQKIDMAEKIEKLKNKIGLELDHIEEMPINFECSSKRIDLNEMDYQEFSADGVNGDSIKENSEEKFTMQSIKKSTPSSDPTPNNHEISPNNNDSNFTVISKVLSEINEIKQCLREKVIHSPSKNGKIENQIQGNLFKLSTSPIISNEADSKQNNFEDSPRIKGRKDLKMIESFGCERPTLKSQQDSELSQFVTNYLNKTYNNVIENSS